jgi:hypothetical protein
MLFELDAVFPRTEDHSSFWFLMQNKSNKFQVLIFIDLFENISFHGF